MAEVKCRKCTGLLMNIENRDEIIRIAMSYEGAKAKCLHCGHMNKFTFAIDMDKPDLDNLELMYLV